MTVLSLIPSAARAQQTIFNVPSADLTEEGAVYLEHESQFRAWDSGRYWYGTHYLAYGFGHHTEGDLTLYNLTSPASDNVSLGMGIKSILPLLKEAHPARDMRWTAGSQALISLEGNGVGFWGYSHLSGRLFSGRTRLSAGASGGTRQLFGRGTVHFIAGVEQGINGRVSLIADWFSGKHGLGFFTSGVSVALPRWSATLFLGYQIPNDSATAGRQGLTFELAKFL